jgi:hypothetical protein
MVDALSKPTAVRPDVVLTESTPRPTPAPARVAFADVLAAGASGLAQGAQTALSAIPGSAVSAAAVRGGGSSGQPMTTMSAPVGAPANLSPEGPGAAPTGALGALGISGTPSAGVGGVGVGGAGSDPSSGINTAVQQSANLNIYFLQLQMEVDAQNRAYTAQSNILKAEHDGAKNAIGNIHS